MLHAFITEHGLLLLQHKSLPSAAGLIAGEPLATSWWSHPRAQEIFRQLDALDWTGDIIATRLIDKRVTFVHRALWPAIYAVGAAREPWQMRRLPRDARSLLDRVDRDKRVAATGPASKLLQQRLLVHAREEHSDSGKHVTMLERWPASKLRVADAKKQLEAAAEKIGATPTMLPWTSRT